ncbi:helix-turn-helix transcriptional regulator [Rhodococcus sp. CH91]|uniref:helix-turn-helix transcriptional regulator n=1 Tax=Rhodococcus sp. CH91 TaxID=2910256 RepID=UPI001F4AD3E8|nr:WYL domain-containing protein [Rhodococcus sp. CH91]
MNRQQRLLSMLVVLQARRRVTAAELAAEFDVSERTVLRDVATLTAADLPVVAERGRYGGILLLPGRQADLGRLSATEVDVLRAVGADMNQARQLGVDAAARDAVHKLTARSRRVPSPHEQREPLLPLTEVVTVDNRGWFATDDRVDVAALTRDLRRGRRLAVTYRSSGRREEREIVVDPYGVLARGGRWYLVAEEQGRPRLYALTRLSSWTVLEQPRRLSPGRTLPMLARELGDALELRGDVVVTAELATDRLDLAHRVLGARLRESTTGPRPATTRITVAYESIEGVRQLLQFGDHIEILGPPEARALVAGLAENLLHRHAP